MDKKLIIGVIIIILVLLVIYLYLGSSTPENLTQTASLNKSNVSGFFL